MAGFGSYRISGARLGGSPNCHLNSRLNCVALWQPALYAALLALRPLLTIIRRAR